MTKRVSPPAFDAALKLLGGREKTRAALVQALDRRGYPAAEVAQALARLEALGYLDERRALEAKARAGLEAGRARAAVEQRLIEAGAEAGLAAEAVGRAAEERGHDDAAVARALLAKRRVSGLKAARLLASRGFDEALIRALVPDLEEG